jgi:hypothetical protein
MTSHTGRLYAVALALVVFFLTWSVVAARPWASSTRSDPRVAALAVREQQVRRESIAVQRIVRRRWAVYRAALKRRRTQIANVHQAEAAAAAAASVQAAPSIQAAPSVQVVTLPPLTITRTS